MDCPLKLNADTWWVGANDRETDLFEEIWPLPHGVSYNAYLIIDERVALIDTVRKSFFPEHLAHVRSALGPDRTIDYIVVNHIEPDHADGLMLLRELFPAAEIVGNKKTLEFLAAMYQITDGTKLVADGDELDLGRHRLRFIKTPMVHWPETMMTHDAFDGTRYAGDAFGGFGAIETGLFDDEADIAAFEDEMLRYFSNIIGKYAVMMRKAIEKLRDVDVRVVAPSHGLVWHKDPGRVIGLYDRWSRHVGEEGAVIAYGSMYGGTTRMMEAVARGLAEGGLSAVHIHDVSHTHPSHIIRDAWRYEGLVLGAPTYDTGVFPPMEHVIRSLQHKAYQDRVVGVFGSYGWAGGGVKALSQFADGGSFELAEPTVEVRFTPGPDDLERCRQLGRNVAERVKTRVAKKNATEE